MTRPPAQPPEDNTDWTRVIDLGCPECGFVPLAPSLAGGWVAASVPLWQSRLAQSDANTRPEPVVWSPVEYAAHIRDLSAVFRDRIALVLEQDDPLLESWDQNQAALSGGYFELDPQDLSGQCATSLLELAGLLDGIAVDQWDRSARRGDGWIMTLEGLVNYYLHDLIHHLADVGITFEPPESDGSPQP